MKIAIVGDGGWGTANALLLSGYGHAVTVWSPFPDYADEVRQTRLNPRYLPGVKIPDSVVWTSSREDAVRDADVVVLASPSKFYGDVCEGFNGLLRPGVLIVSLTKGLCEKTHARMSEVARETLGQDKIISFASSSRSKA